VSPQDICAVCGRTFLVGERAHSFVSAEGRHEVCELCAARTAELGWLPADQEGAEEELRAATGRRPGLLARLFARSGRPAEVESADDAPAPGPGGFDDEGLYDEPRAIEEMQPPPPGATPLATHELDTERFDVEAEWEAERPTNGRAADLPAPDEVPEPEVSPPPAAPAPTADASPAPLPDPAGRGMRPRRLQPDLSPTSRFERAISRFNASEAGRTVAGLTRTLGAPSVSVGDLAGAADEVRVTVAWELTWYQWGVDLGDELRPVYELQRGFEIDEIDAAARQWNASAHDGRVVMVAPRAREAVDGRPVRH
jgi:hypothetical protein